MTTLPRYDELKPRAVWEAFAGLASVPRPSFHEGRVRQHVLAWARTRGLVAEEDAADNIVVRVPAKPGFESAPTVILQGHVDMVCIKRAASAHDFMADPIRLIVDERDSQPIVRADDTTLGADNGIGCALAMALAVDKQAQHGPLELLFTVNEEAGMTGARGLASGMLSGRYLLNLDTEEDDHLCIGCAGALTSALVWRMPTVAMGHGREVFEVSVSGLPGGHSGMEIHQRRGNAVNFLARALVALEDVVEGIVLLEGGTKRNAIPDAARAVVCGAAGSMAKANAVLAELRATFEGELAEAYRADLAVGARAWASTDALRVLDAGLARRAVRTLADLPAGPISFDPNTPGLVHTSNNPAIVSTAHGAEDPTLTLENSSRSLADSGLDDLRALVDRIAAETGAVLEGVQAYPPWEPRYDGTLLRVAREVHESLLGVAPHVITIHAGLECGLFAERLPGVEMISFGPRIEEAHTPNERVFPRSVERCYGYLCEVVRRLATEPR